MVQVSDVAKGMAAVLRLIPQFALGDGLMNMSFMQVCACACVRARVRECGSTEAAFL